VAFKNIRWFTLIRPTATFSLEGEGTKREVGRAVPARRGIRGRLGTAVPTPAAWPSSLSQRERVGEREKAKSYTDTLYITSPG